MLLGLSGNDRGRESDLIAGFIQAGAQGLIAFPVEGELYNEQIVRLSLERYPLVLLDRWLPGINVSHVVGDHAGGTAQAVEYLVKLGHRRIAIAAAALPFPLSTQSVRERIRGYGESLKAAGFAVDDELMWIHDASEDDGHEGSLAYLSERLTLHDGVTAVIAISIANARLVCEAARRCRRRIPDDLSLIAFDLGGQVAGFEQFFAKGGQSDPVAWIDQSEYTMGEQAARLVCHLTEDSTATEAIQIPVVLRPGATCAAL
jgi:GntR family transcriptional regulator of arabinose operon